MLHMYRPNMSSVTSRCGNTSRMIATVTVHATNKTLMDDSHILVNRPSRLICRQQSIESAAQSASMSVQVLHVVMTVQPSNRHALTGKTIEPDTVSL